MISTMDDTLQHALFLAQHLNGCEVSCIVILVLLELDVPTKSIGFDYLKQGVLLYYGSPGLTATKDIYPEIGTRYSPKAGSLSVEQAIRRAINEAWIRKDRQVWARFFPLDDSGNLIKPSNAEFISRIARFVELWYGCCKGSE